MDFLTECRPGDGMRTALISRFDDICQDNCPSHSLIPPSTSPSHLACPPPAVSLCGSSGACETFSSSCLSKTEDFRVKHVEVGSSTDSTLTCQHFLVRTTVLAWKACIARLSPLPLPILPPLPPLPQQQQQQRYVCIS